MNEQSLILTVPIKTNLFDLTNKKGQLYLVIKVENDLRRYQILNLFKENLSDTTSLTPLKLYKLTSLGKKIKDKSILRFQNSSDENKLSNKQPNLKVNKLQSLNKLKDNIIMESNCVHYYWVDTYYENDVEVDQHWSYLFSTGCGTNGPNGVDQEEQPPGDTGTGKDESLDTDCESFVFIKTSGANWQEAGLNKIKLEWVWVGGSNRLIRHIDVNHIVFGLPTYYTKSNGDIVELSAGV
ncbi:hypothetical protein [Pedobacter sp. Leaf170]|uniref:hypothetical protein n=1 Tax=Pedobacter sp. Leaf170 TaxID=2876558 RepID=UPI001E55D506|nr:hypothetical protein [Pedobacter sp. Leaf170]